MQIQTEAERYLPPYMWRERPKLVGGQAIGPLR